jgi:transcription antitermination factor NusG
MALHISTSQWYAIQTLSRHEDAVFRQLESRGYESFLPTHFVRRTWSDRVKTIRLPLFPGYLFCRIDPSIQARVVTTPGAVRIVGAGRTPYPVDDDEIEGIRMLVSSGRQVQPWPYISIGHHVRVVGGPLCGVRGVVVASGGQSRLVVSVTLLQRSVAVELDTAWLQMESDRGHDSLDSLAKGAVRCKTI